MRRTASFLLLLVLPFFGRSSTKVSGSAMIVMMITMVAAPLEVEVEGDATQMRCVYDWPPLA